MCRFCLFRGLALLRDLYALAHWPDGKATTFNRHSGSTLLLHIYIMAFCFCFPSSLGFVSLNSSEFDAQDALPVKVELLAYLTIVHQSGLYQIDRTNTGRKSRACIRPRYRTIISTTISSRAGQRNLQHETVAHQSHDRDANVQFDLRYRVFRLVSM